MNPSLNILHLEDNPYDAELVQTVLRDEGLEFTIHQVTAKSDFTAALEKGGWGMILADYRCPILTVSRPWPSPIN